MNLNLSLKQTIGEPDRVKLCREKLQLVILGRYVNQVKESSQMELFYYLWLFLTDKSVFVPPKCLQDCNEIDIRAAETAKQTQLTLPNEMTATFNMQQCKNNTVLYFVSY